MPSAERQPDPTARRSHRSAVIGAALEIADAEGVDAVTMRRVASELELPVMTLYGFVRTKAELLEALGASALAELQEPNRGGGPWDAEITTLTRRLYEALIRHPSAVELILTHAAPSHSFDHVRETILQTLHEAGFAPRDALNVMGALVSYALGFAVAAGRQRRFPELTATEPDRLRRLHPDQFPRLTAVADEYPNHLSDRAFELGLRQLVSGFGAVRALRPSG